MLRVLPGTSQATLSVAQQLATPEAGFGPFTDRVAIVGDLDASGRSALFVVGTLKGVAYAGPPGAIATVKQLTLADFGRTPLGGF